MGGGTSRTFRQPLTAKLLVQGQPEMLLLRVPLVPRRMCQHQITQQMPTPASANAPVSYTMHTSTPQRSCYVIFANGTSVEVVFLGLNLAYEQDLEHWIQAAISEGRATEHVC